MVLTFSGIFQIHTDVLGLREETFDEKSSLQYLVMIVPHIVRYRRVTKGQLILKRNRYRVLIKEQMFTERGAEMK